MSEPEGAAATFPADRAVASPSARLARSASLVGSATMTSRLLAVAREQAFAFYFGAGDQMDAYKVAFRLPNLLRDLFAEGAMSAAFTPTFTRYLTARGRDEAWRLGNLVLTALLIVTGALTVAGIVFARPLALVFAPRFEEIPGKLELTITLTRIMFPFLPLIAMAVAFMGMLNALRWFFVPALSPAMFNVAAIASVFLLVPAMPLIGLPPVAGLAIGTLLGGVGQAAMQWPALRKEGFRFRFRFAPRDPGLREVLLLMGPSTIGLAAVQINQFVNTYLATGEGSGAVSWLDYAFRLMYLPIGLFGVSIATAAIPAIAGHAALEQHDGMRRTISSALRLMLMLNVPATLGLIALAEPIVSLIYEYGRFTSTDTHAVAGALMCYAPGLIGYSSVKVASPSFYSLRDSRTPAVVSAASVIVNVVLNLTLVRVFGFRGLAAGTAIAALFNAGTLLWLLRRRLNGLEERRITIAFVKILAASIIMAGAAVLTERLLGVALPGESPLVRLVQVFSAIGVALVVLAAAARVLRIAEFDEALKRVLSRTIRRPR